MTPPGGSHYRATVDGEFRSCGHETGLSSASEHAYAALVAGGSTLVFTAGACPLDPDGATVGAGDIRAQAVQTMENLAVVLADAGARLEDVLRTTVYVASSDQRDLVAAWEVVRDALAPHDLPGTLLGVAALGYGNQLVEFDAVAALTFRDSWPDCYARPGVLPVASAG